MELKRRPPMEVWKIHSPTRGYLTGSRAVAGVPFLRPVFSKTDKDHEIWYVSTGAQRRLEWAKRHCPDAKLKVVKI